MNYYFLKNKKYDKNKIKKFTFIYNTIHNIYYILLFLLRIIIKINIPNIFITIFNFWFS